MVDGKRYLVTGGSRGIGRAIVEAIVAKGGRVAALARKKESLDSLVQAHEGKVVAIGCDLSSSEDFAAIADEANNAFGGLDGLVNCAGVIHRQMVGTIDKDSITQQLGVNVIAPLLLSQAVASVLRGAGKGGVIVNVSSSLSQRPAPGTLVYSATKAALDSLTKSLAMELAADSIRVNAVLSGVVRTDMVKDMLEADGEMIERMHGLGRLGTPEDIANVVVQIIENEWQTGSLVVVDGGLLSRP